LRSVSSVAPTKGAFWELSHARGRQGELPPTGK
jgi:hypothetical protein